MPPSCLGKSTNHLMLCDSHEFLHAKSTLPSDEPKKIAAQVETRAAMMSNPERVPVALETIQQILNRALVFRIQIRDITDGIDIGEYEVVGATVQIDANIGAAIEYRQVVGVDGG